MIELPPPPDGWVRLFVYGSLKRGRAHHDRLEAARARFVCEARTAPGYELVDFTAWPGMRRGGFGAVIPPWFGYKSQAVTVAVNACIDC